VLSKTLEEIEAERQSRKIFRQTKKEIKEARSARLRVLYANFRLVLDG